MSEIKLRAKRKNPDDWLLFGITELFHGENGYFQVCVEEVGLFAIDPATIQPADDPRKAMLAEIRQLIKRLSPQHGGFVMLDKLLPALDEMESKL